MTEHSQGPAGGLGNGNRNWSVSKHEPLEEDKVMDGSFSSNPLDSSTVSDTDTSKDSELASEKHVGSMALIPQVTQTDNHLEDVSIVPHTNQKLR